MKQRILLFSLLVFSTGLFAQDVPTTQMPLVTKVTATWCTNCGSWGWDLFEGLVEDNKDKALLVAAHPSGGLVSPAGSSFSSNFNAIGQPKFYLNNEDQRPTRNSVAAKRTEIGGLIDDMRSQSPVANVGFIANMADGKITVRTKTKFFEAAQGEYYLSLYILENNVVASQTSRGSNAVHKEILRTSFDSDVFGQQLTTMSDISADMEFTNMHEIDVNLAWNTANLTLAGMIWKKEGATYQYVNGNKTNDFDGDLTSSVQNAFSEVSDFSVLPNIISNNATVQLNLEQSIQNAQINVYDLTGKKLKTIFSGNLSGGVQSFEIEKGNLPNGMVFITLEAKGEQYAVKAIVK